MESFVFEVADESHWESVCTLVVQDFGCRELLIQRSGEQRGWDGELPPCFKDWIAEGNSLVVKDTTTDRVVGYSLNPVARQPDESRPPSGDAVLDFLEELEVDCDVFERFNLERGIELCLLNVDKEFCGRGLGRRLVERTIEHGRHRGYQFIKTSCTSPWMLHVFQELGFQVLKQLKLADHCVNQTKAFPLATPEEVSTFLVKLL